MASFLYNKWKEMCLKGTADFTSGTWKVMLVTSGYAPDKDHLVVDDGVSASSARPGQNEISTTNYAPGFAGAGRGTLAGIVVTQDNTNDLANLAATNQTFTSIGPPTGGPTVAGAILYKHVTNDAASNLVAFFDGGMPQTVNGGNFVVSWNASGVLKIT